MENAYTEKSKMSLSKKSIELLTEERNKLKGLYSRFELALRSPLDEEASAADLDSLQFKEKLIQIQKKLREDANMYDLRLPESLGFSKYETELSDSSEIPHLIKRLNVLEELIYIMAIADIESLDKIEFAEKEDDKKASKKTAPKEVREIAGRNVSQLNLPGGMQIIRGTEGEIVTQEDKASTYSDIPISFVMNCTSSTLVSFLHKLGLSPLIFVVEDMDIKRARDFTDQDKSAEEKLKVNFSIKAIVLK